MNDLVKFGGNVPVNAADLIAGLQNVSQGIHDSAGGLPFLRLLKTGQFAYGPESIEPQEGSEWALNPASMQHGYACWGDGELLDEVMVPANQQKPARTELVDYGQPWSEQVAVMLQCMNGEDEGVQVLYKGTSLGLRNAIKQLIQEMVTQLQHDGTKPIPVLALNVDSYHHKKYGETFTPELVVTRWIGFDAKTAVTDESDTDEAPSADVPDEQPAAEAPAAAPPRRRRRAAAAAPAGDSDPKPEAKAEEKPATNRRRRRPVAK